MNINKSTKSYLRFPSGLTRAQCAQFKKSKRLINKSKSDIYNFYKYFKT